MLGEGFLRVDFLFFFFLGVLLFFDLDFEAVGDGTAGLAEFEALLFLAEVVAAGEPRGRDNVFHDSR